MPPRGRFSLIHVDDLCRADARARRARRALRRRHEPDDGTPGGWTHRDFARALGNAVGKKPAILPAPGTLMRIAAHADQLVRGPKAKLTVDRAAYFSHHDWVIDPARAPPPGLWHPQVETGQGLAQTAAWYRAQGWL